MNRKNAEVLPAPQVSEEGLIQKYLSADKAARQAEEERSMQVALAERYKKAIVIKSNGFSNDFKNLARNLSLGKVVSEQQGTSRNLRSAGSPERGKPRIHTHEPVTFPFALEGMPHFSITYSKLTLGRKKFREEEIMLENDLTRIRILREYEGRSVVTIIEMHDQFADQYLAEGVPTIHQKPGHTREEAPDILDTLGIFVQAIRASHLAPLMP